ncbi:uncharacterized protein LTR77_002725 [Saxophila tyrrhenica]|uniref:SCP domain-containing protein n=1 Tax=Saxophila tyrrhenica TaxID=1690608 RepID=A0AAV9PJV7_9PEZI|nr:hypothetical protein LTR77_002725 [Saxophila tyrrhenica]
MRSAILAAAFAASAIAVPFAAKRDVVVNTNTEVVYVTEYYTVTGGAAPATPTPEAKAAAAPKKHWGHKPHWWGGHKPNKGHTTQQPATTAPQATWEPAPTKTKTKSPEPPAETSAASAPPSSSPPTSGYSDKVIWHHNVHRTNHSAPDIEWDAGLAATALKIAQTCSYEHNTKMDGGGYGQNIAAGVDGDSVDRVITNMFYNGEVNYYTGLYKQAQPDMSNFEKWGHFSQIVWKGTTHVGCATYHCTNGLQNTGDSVPPYFTVCNYASPGNFANEYGDNVGEPLDHATVTCD